MRLLGRGIPTGVHRLPPVPSEVYYDDPEPAKGTTRSITAAAQRFINRTVRRNRAGAAANQRRAWQAEAWDRFYDTPEVRFAAMWIANAMSRAVLKPGIVDDDGETKDLPDGHPAHELVANIAGGPDGQAQLLRQFGLHLVVAGEGWIVIEPASDENTDLTDESDLVWHVLSVEEVKHEQKGRLTALIDDREIDITPSDQAGVEDPVAIRIWDPSPRRRIEADSPIRSSLGLLDELRLLSASVRAIARSRLVGRGILAVPQGARFPTTPGTSDGEDDLLDLIMTVAETAYRDPESAAATVPIMLELPPDVVDGLKHITFESEYDEIAIKLREEAIRRFATGLDTPPEILLGTGSVNHWGQWQLTAEAIRLAIEPRLSILADGLTRWWIRPILSEMGHDDAARIVVLADSAPLRVRSNRSQTALELYREGAISLAALRRETGFDDDDAVADEDAERDLLIKLLLAHPSYAPTILPMLGVEVPADWAAASRGGAPGHQGGGAAPVLPVDETNDPPDDGAVEADDDPHVREAA